MSNSIWFIIEVFFHRTLPSKPFPDVDDPGFDHARQFNQSCAFPGQFSEKAFPFPFTHSGTNSRSIMDVPEHDIRNPRTQHCHLAGVPFSPILSDRVHCKIFAYFFTDFMRFFY